MIKNFSQYLVEEEREVFFTFGRMNPPTVGHGKVMDTLSTKSGKSDYKVFVSQSQDPKKNPLSYSDKIKHTRKMFPKHARNIIADKSVKTAINAMVALYDQGYKSVTMVVGEDRITEFDVLLKKYNGTKGRHGFYNFKNINIVSAGERDPDASGVEGMSASKQRENAANNDFVTFAQGVPKSMSDKDTRKLFNDVRKGMGLKEALEFRNHLELKTVSETREQYVAGSLFEVGDTVVIKESDEVATVVVLGANYVIVEHNDKKSRKWLDAVEKLEEDVSQRQIDDLEKFGDRLLKKFDIDVEFTRHFADRMNDKRNDPEIKVAEIQRLFKKIAKNKGKDIKKHGDAEAVLKDMQSDLNLPVVVNFKDGEFEVVNKTIMRKKGFKTTSPEIKYEAQDPDIKDKEGTQPARYHAGLKKSTKDKRDAHFKKHGKKADNDSSAYKPAPGDATAKTKPSKYTKAFKDMYEEQDKILENWVTDLMNKLDAKSIHRNKYKKVAQYIKKELDKSGDGRSIEYHAANTIRKFNLDMDTKALAGMIRQLA
jgi:transcription elongation GreA/GreB family factor